MAWEIAKGIVLAVFILIGIALGLAILLGLLCVGYHVTREILRSLIEEFDRPAVLKLTSSSKGWILPFTNRQAAVGIGILIGAIAIVVFISIHNS